MPRDLQPTVDRFGLAWAVFDRPAGVRTVRLDPKTELPKIYRIRDDARAVIGLAISKKPMVYDWNLPEGDSPNP